MTVPSSGQSLLASIETEQPLPLTVTRLARLVCDDSYDTEQVVELVSLDPVLTAALLRRANSSAAGSSSPIATVRQAVVRIGTGPLMSLAFAVSVAGRLSTAVPEYGLAEGELWRRSVAASVGAEVVRSAARVAVPVEAATAALLHDIGLLLLARHLRARRARIPYQSQEWTGAQLLAAEVSQFGVHHAAVGGLVVAKWRLPRTIVDAVMHHHDVSDQLSPIAATVSLAHAMIPWVLDAAAARTDASLQPVVESHAVVLRGLGIEERAYAEVLAVAQRRYRELSDRYRVE